MYVGCWFGVENDPKLGMFVPGVDLALALASVDTSIDTESLSQTLTELLFAEEEMAFGRGTKPRRPGKGFMLSEVSACQATLHH